MLEFLMVVHRAQLFGTTPSDTLLDFCDVALGGAIKIATVLDQGRDFKLVFGVETMEMVVIHGFHREVKRTL